MEEPFDRRRLSLPRRVNAILLAYVIAEVLCGCAIIEMRKDNQDREIRIDEKTHELSALEQTNSQLVSERDSFAADLQRRQLSADELQQRLSKLQTLNDVSQATTPQERGRRDERTRQIKAVRQQIQTLEDSTGMSDEEKKEKLEALRTRTRMLLNILLVS